VDNRFELTELIHSTDLEGPFRLYIYGPDGYHSGGMWFESVPKYPEEEITSREAKAGVEASILSGREVRITNSSDFLVYHAINGQVIYPPDPEAFWRAVL